MSCYLNQVAAVCALGQNIQAISQSLFTATQSPLLVTDHYSPGRPLPLGQVAQLTASADTRNNSLLSMALAPLQPEVETLKARFGAHRLGVIIGSSTSGILEGEQAITQRQAQGALPPAYRYQQQEIAAPSQFVAQYLGLTGPAWTISTACTSGARAIASAARLLRLGVVDAVIAGGADSLCRLTVQGFAALEAVSPELCNPFSKNRRGINIGEAAALFIISRAPGPVRLAGVGESSDAHHISAPHPEGDGAARAMQQALTAAGITAPQVDYLNAHGTATEQNDRMEARAIARVLGDAVAVGSSKALTGHTLGAAGALEAAFCWLTLARNDGILPRHLWDAEADPALPALAGLGASQTGRPVRTAMSNSFAFGGNNISLLFERCYDPTHD